MSKLKLKLKEAEEKDFYGEYKLPDSEETVKVYQDDEGNFFTEDDTPITKEELDTYEEVVEEPTDDVQEDDTEDPTSWIDSDELNELRDIILDIDDNIQLLLLDDAVVVPALVDSENTLVYTIPEDSEDEVLIPLPLQLDNILNDDTIIKYTPEGPDARHQHFVDILMQKLNPSVEEDDSDEQD